VDSPKKGRVNGEIIGAGRFKKKPYMSLMGNLASILLWQKKKRKVSK